MKMASGEKLASSVLGKRARGGDAWAVCGVPYHIDNGHTSLLMESAAEVEMRGLWAMSRGLCAGV